MRKNITFLLLFLFITQISLARQDDTGRIKVKTQSTENASIQSIDELSQLATSNPEKVVSISKSWIKRIEGKGKIKASELPDLYIVLGNSYMQQGQYSYAFGAYLSALKYLEISGTEIEKGIAQNHLGKVYLKLNLFEEAIKKFKNAENLFLKAELSKSSLHLSSTFQNISEAYSNLNLPDSSEIYLNKSIELLDSKKDEINLAQAYLLKARLEGSKGNNGGALKLYHFAKETFIRNADISNLGKTFFEEGKHHYRNGNYKEAKKNFRYSTISFAKVESKKSVYQSKIMLGKSLLALRVDSFPYTQMSGLVDTLINSKFYEELQQASLAMIDYFKARRKHQQALLYYEIYHQASLVLSNNEISGLMNSYEANKKVEEARLANLELTKKNQLQEIHMEAQSEKQVLYIVLIGLFLLAVVVLFLRYSSIKRLSKELELKNAEILKQEQKVIQAKDEQIEYEKSLRKKEMTNNALYIIEQNKFNEGIVRDLQRLNLWSRGKYSQELKDIITKLLNHSTISERRKFEMEFKKLHKEFFDRIEERYPKLTSNERRLCSFLKLNMSSREISNVTNQSIRSIEVARSRLRKKLNMGQEDNLTQFLNSI